MKVCDQCDETKKGNDTCKSCGRKLQFDFICFNGDHYCEQACADLSDMDANWVDGT